MMAGKNGRGRTGTGSKTPDFLSQPSRVIDYASRLTVKPETLTAGERRCSVRRVERVSHMLEKVKFTDTNARILKIAFPNMFATDMSYCILFYSLSGGKKLKLSITTFLAYSLF